MDRLEALVAQLKPANPDARYTPISRLATGWRCFFTGRLAQAQGDLVGVREEMLQNVPGMNWERDSALALRVHKRPTHASLYEACVFQGPDTW